MNFYAKPGNDFSTAMAYLGFVGFVIPYAFAIAALVTGRTDDRWIRINAAGHWWPGCSLSIGLCLGCMGYDVLAGAAIGAGIR